MNVKYETTVTKKILVIDDDEASFLLIEEIFAHFNIQLFWANTFQSACEFVGSGTNYSLIIIDYRLPDGKYGTELLPIIKQLLPETSLLFITAISINHSKELQTLNNEYEILLKPIDINYLVCKVREILSITMEFS